MAHPPCGTAQILLKRGCAATSLCCAPSAGDSQVARSRHHHTHRLGGGMMVPPLSPPWGQPWPGQAVPFRRSSGRHGAAPLPPPLLRGTQVSESLVFMMSLRGEWPPRMPTPFTIPALTPAAREPLPTWQGELRRLAATQLLGVCETVPAADRSGGRAWRHVIGSG